MRQLRCAVIGCGRIGCGFDDNTQNKVVRTHAGCYFKNSSTKLVALCDVDKKKLLKYGKKYKVQNLYQNTTEMFKKEKLDCISVCTLVETHYDIILDAVKAGVKGIFLEKPMTDNLRDARVIIDTCKKNNVILQIDHQRRFHPLYQSIKKALENNELGKIELVNMRYGGGIANTGSHMFDLLVFFFGNVKSITGNFSKNLLQNNLDPNIDAQIYFENNINCIINSFDYGNYVIFEMDIFGTTGRLHIDLVHHQYKFHKMITRKISGYNTLLEKKLKIANPKLTPIYLGLENLIQSIRTGKKPMCTGEDGYKSLELIVAAIKSTKEKNEILLPLQNEVYKITSK